MEILGFQLIIVLSLITARFFGRHVLLVVALCWTVETFVLIITPQLSAFQLAVIWLTFWAISVRAGTLAVHFAGRRRMKAAATLDREARAAVEILMGHVSRIQNTKREAHALGPEYVAKYDKLYGKLLARLPKKDLECLERQNSLSGSTRQEPEPAGPHQAEHERVAHAQRIASRDEFLEKTRVDLSSDPEKRAILVDLTERLKLPHLRKLLISSAKTG